MVRLEHLFKKFGGEAYTMCGGCFGVEAYTVNVRLTRVGIYTISKEKTPFR